MAVVDAVKRAVLISRWRGQEGRMAAICDAIKSGTDWTQYVADWNGAGPLFGSGAAEVPKDSVTGYPRDLRGIRIVKTELPLGCGSLCDTALDYALFIDVSWRRGILNGVAMRGARLQRVDLELAQLTNVDWEGASILDVRLNGAEIRRCNWRGCVMQRSEFVRTALSEISMREEAPLGMLGEWIGMGRGTRVREFQHGLDHAYCGGIDDDALEFLREQLREDRIDRAGKWFGAVYSALTCYGRNFARLGLWVLVVVVLYGNAYAGAAHANTNHGAHMTVVDGLRPEFRWGEVGNVPRNAIEPYYFSVVTLTTLGYGDIVPINVAGEVCAASESLLGVILLGMFVSMLVGYAGRRER